MAADSVSKLSLKLLIDTKSNKVLFAEAGKDFIDFLFNLLSLPLGTVIKLLKTSCMVGSLGELYESIENLSDTYMQSDKKKDSVLNPRASAPVSGVPRLLAYDVGGKVYMCRHYHRNVADDSRTVCPQCKESMSNEVPVVAPVVREASGGGFVKAVVTYMVMDDLTVQPLSTISTITLLNKFNVKEVGALEEKVVHLGMDEGLKLLKCSLQSKTVLTSVFLEK